MEFETVEGILIMSLKGLILIETPKGGIWAISKYNCNSITEIIDDIKDKRLCKISLLSSIESVAIKWDATFVSSRRKK